MLKLSRTTNYIASSLSISLAIAFAISANPAMSQQLALEQQTGAFKLKATMQERPTLTRGDMEGSSSNAGNPIKESSRSNGDDALPLPDVNFAMPSSPAGNSFSSPNTTAAGGRGFNLNAQQQDTVPPEPTMATAQPQQPDGMMEEYGVDWSKWVSRVVDQWFVKLQQLEGNSGLQFHTQGPALLKFTAYPDGHIEILGLKRSSGVPMYDQMQADALVQSQPLPAFPRGTKKTSYTLVQGWDSHPKQENEQDFQLGSYKGNLPMEKIRQWIPGR